jgi:hypothetical protein
MDLYRPALAVWVGKAAFDLSVFDALIAGLTRSMKPFMLSRQHVMHVSVRP